MKLVEKRTAFTLIELLVVIAIIALLLSIIMPALNTAKKQAGIVVCSSNVRQIVVAWRMYAEDNDSLVCGAQTGNGKYPEYDWVSSPEDASGNRIDFVSGSSTEEENRGVEMGSLYPYYEDYKVVHCPQDKRFKNTPTFSNGLYFGGNGGYRSYSFATTLGLRNSMSRLAISKLTEIKSPSTRYVLIEENDSRGINWNGWVMDLEAPAFVDPFGVFHNDRSVLAFGDGHVEKIAWKDPDTMKHSHEINDGKTDFYFKDPGSVDLQWLALHYPKK